MKNMLFRFAAVMFIVFLLVSVGYSYKPGNLWRYNGGLGNIEVYTVPAGKSFLLYGALGAGYGHPVIIVDGQTLCSFGYGNPSGDCGFASYRFDPPIKFPSGTVFRLNCHSTSSLMFYGYEGPSGVDEGQLQESSASVNSSTKSYPVPFSKHTSINYNVPKKEKVSIKIYDEAGRLVRTLINEELESGSYTARWDGKNLEGEEVSNGSYFCIVKTNGTSKIKLVHIK